MVIDHIGYAVKDIEGSKKYFETLGFKFEENINDGDRNSTLCFGVNGGYRIELIAPNSDEQSPVDTYLKKVGPIMYHICYKVDDIEESIEALKKSGFILTKSPAKAVAFNNNKVAFMYNTKIGSIELVET